MGGTTDPARAQTRRRSLLVGVVAALVLAVVASATLGRDDPSPDSVPVAGGTSTSAPGAEGGSFEDADAFASAPPETTPGVEDTDLTPIRMPRSGVYRYSISEFVDGERRDRVEDRLIERITLTDRDGTFRMTTVRDDTEQVQVIETSDSGRFVLGTTLTTPFGVTECAWSPSWPTNGPLRTGQQWTYDSTCTGRIGEATTDLSVSGVGLVRGPVVFDFAAEGVPMWLVERSQDATVLITAGVERIEQRVVEQRTDWIDPLRGIVIRSDSTSTLSGTSEGTITSSELFLNYASLE